jgi:hypothetical protein
MRPPTRAADGDVGIDAHLRERRRQQRERESVVTPERPDAIENGSPDLDVRELRECGLGREERRVERRGGEGAGQREDDPLCAPALGQVVVNERDTGFQARQITERDEEPPLA